MRVLSDIAGLASKALLRAGRPGAEARPVNGGSIGAMRSAYNSGEAYDRARQERRLIRRLARAFALPMVAVPVALSFALGPAIALPIGSALVFSVFLVVAVLVIGRARSASDAVSVAPAPGTAPVLTPSHCPGLLVTLDAQGIVCAIDGRDQDDFAAYMRAPSGRALAEQFHVSDRISFLQALDAIRQGAGKARAELRMQRNALHVDEAQFIGVRADLSAIRDGAGTLTNILVQVQDGFGEVDIREEMKHLQSVAEQANETKSRFLAAVSHEMRTPLNAILGFSDILAGEYFGKLENDRQREYVTLIRQSGAHLLSVVNTMLDMSKIEAGRYELLLEPFRPADVVRECESMLALQAREKGVALTSRLSRNLGDVVADQRALRQILINLVGNAIKFTEEGGAIVIDAFLDGDKFKLVVSDTGIGIPAEKMELIGQPFTQAHDELSRRFDGSGLGLSLVKGLTALHGGRFELTSRQGEGTVAAITIPADGSGADLDAGADDEGTMVEFPPRLKTAANSQSITYRDEKEGHSNGAKAKIA